MHPPTAGDGEAEVGEGRCSSEKVGGENFVEFGLTAQIGRSGLLAAPG